MGGRRCAVGGAKRRLFSRRAMARDRLFPLRGKGLDGFSTILCVLCGNKNSPQRTQSPPSPHNTLRSLRPLREKKNIPSRTPDSRPACRRGKADRTTSWRSAEFFNHASLPRRQAGFVAQRGTLNTKPGTLSRAVARLLVGCIEGVPYFYSLSNQSFFITKIPFLCIAFSMCCSASLCAQRSSLPAKKARRPPGSSS